MCHGTHYTLDVRQIAPPRSVCEERVAAIRDYLCYRLCLWGIDWHAYHDWEEGDV